MTSCASDRRATALLETAIVMPFLVAMVLGVLEFANYFWSCAQMETGVRDAARYLARRDGDSTGDPTSITGDVTAAKNLAVTGNIAGGTPRVPGWTTADVTTKVFTIANTTGTYRGRSTIYVVQVATEPLYRGLGFLPYFGITDLRIRAFHQERVINE